MSVAIGGISSSGGKKTAEAIQKEVAQEIDQLLRVIFADLRKSGRLDLEAVEMATRTAMHQAGAAVLKELLQKSRSEVAREVACPCGQQARFHEMRPKQILTVLGRIYMQRAYYVCGHCHDGQSPLDWELDIEGTECSPGVRRMMALVGSDGPFEHGRRQIEELAGLDVTSKTIERHAETIGEDIARQEEAEVQRAIQLDLPEVNVADIPVMYVEMDGTGVPVVASETEGRMGKIEGQSARTREAKLGCVFTQTATDDQGRPVRDEDSTTYTGAIETAELFGRRLYAEAHHRGWNRAKRKVVIGDGAIWIWNIADEHFPTAIQIVDLYHARQHLWELSAKLFSSDPQQRLRWVKQLQQKLDAGKIESLVKTLHAFPPSSDELAKLLATESEYFARNAERMRYPKFRADHLFIGSGVIEAGCKTVIGSRLKKSGMFWTVRGANAIIALRCNRLSDKFQDYWESRRAA
ncbi:MAG: ISKra4 family transposase [Acidobacteria bacterium]|nr:MAG: ISKra4 family transposase [Acidobacteriota bacterium]